MICLLMQMIKLSGPFNKLLCYCFVFWSGTVKAQTDTSFLSHLIKNNLVKEELAYLNTFTSQTDTVCYYKSLFYIRTKQDSLFFNEVVKATEFCLSSPVFVRQTSCYFFEKGTDSSKEKWFALLKSKAHKNHFQKYITVFDAANRPKLYRTENFQGALQPAFVNYRKACGKSPLLAMGLSAVVPGSGKWYAGQPKLFLSTFFMNAAYAVQTIESTRRLGFHHPFNYINLGGFAIFYLSNIYGSYKSVKTLQRESKIRFLYEASRFYN